MNRSSDMTPLPAGRPDSGPSVPACPAPWRIGSVHRLTPEHFGLARFPEFPAGIPLGTVTKITRDAITLSS